MDHWNNKRPWTEEEDALLAAYVAHEGERSWMSVREKMGLDRNGYSCWHRWTKYLKPKLTPAPGMKGTEKEMKSQNLNSVLHSTPVPASAPSQNVHVLPMDNILTDITNKRSKFSSGYPIHGKKRARVAEATSSNPDMLLKPGTVLARNNISAPIGTQRSASIRSGNVPNSNSKELPSLQRNATLPERIRSHIVHYSMGIPSSILTTSNTNQSTLCKEHEGHIAHASSDAKHAISDGVVRGGGCLITSQGTNYSLEELLGQIEEQVMSESQLGPISLVKGQVERSVDHLVREFETLVQNSDAKNATSDGGVAEGSHLIIPHETDCLMEERLGETEKQETSENLHSVLHSTLVPVPVPSQNVGVLPMDNILTDITNKRSKFSSGYPIHGKKRARIDGAASSNSNMLLKPGTVLARNNISAPNGTQQSATIQNGNTPNSNSKELPSLQRNATLPGRIRSHRAHYSMGMKLIPTSFLTTSNTNQSTLCREHEGHIAHAPSDANHATSEVVMMERAPLIISQGTNYSLEELLGQIEERVMSESQLGSSSLVKEQVDSVDHLVREFETLVQNSDAKHATSGGGMAEGSHLIMPHETDRLMEEQLAETEKQERSENLGECGKLIQYSEAKYATSDGGIAECSHFIIPQGTYHLMEEQLGQTEKQERSENLGIERGTLIQCSGAGIYEEGYFSDEDDAEIHYILKGFLTSGPSPYLYPP